MNRQLFIEMVMVGTSAAIAAGVTWWLDRPRVHRAEVETARERSLAARQELDAAIALPQLPVVDVTWKATRALWQACGLEIAVQAGPPAPPPSGGYTGPTYAWHAMLRGPAERLFWCLEQASTLPVLVNTVAVTPGGMAGANIAVLGKTGETRVEAAAK